VKILILGGSVFIGRHITEAALANGHEVTLFNRGRQASPFSANVENLIGDRHGDLAVLQNRQWDAVVDVSGYVPSAVEAAARLLCSNVETYLYISSISVYGTVTKSVDEITPVVEINDDDLPAAEKLSGEESPTAMTYCKYYGPLKARCESIVKQYFPKRHVILRPGLVAGSYDYTNRMAYWITRLQQGGDYLAPHDAETPVRFIDVKDLADWTVKCIESNNFGVYNMPGPSDLTLGELFKTMQALIKSDAKPVWLPEEFLLGSGVKPWIEIPLWLPKSLQGIFRIGDHKAIAKGLSYRSLAASLLDIISWLDETAPVFKLVTGIDGEKEQALIAQWLR